MLVDPLSSKKQLHLQILCANLIQKKSHLPKSQSLTYFPFLKFHYVQNVVYMKCYKSNFEIELFLQLNPIEFLVYISQEFECVCMALLLVSLVFSSYLPSPISPCLYECLPTKTLGAG